MTEDKDIIKNFELLDSILSFLIHDCDAYNGTFNDLYFKLTNRDLTEDKKIHAQGYLQQIIDKSNPTIEDFFSIGFSDNTLAQGEKIVEACYFLMHNNYIRISPTFDLKITYEGIIKYSKSFKQEYKDTENKRLFDKWSSLITFGISLVTFLIGLKLQDILSKYFH